MSSIAEGRGGRRGWENRVETTYCSSEISCTTAVSVALILLNCSSILQSTLLQYCSYLMTFCLCRRVRFPEFSPEQVTSFQCNILKTILQLETTFFELAEHDKKNVLIVCDRGTMDPSACNFQHTLFWFPRVPYRPLPIRHTGSDPCSSMHKD